MTLPRGLISEEIASAIKVDLWAGHMTQEAVAEKYNVSQPTISRIFRGRDWPQLPWPDGSLGHIPTERRAIIHASRHRKTRYQHDPRAGHSELAPKEVSDINSVVENLLAIEDSNFLDTIKRKAGETRRRAPQTDGVGSRKYRGDMLPWPDIKESDPGHPVVQELERQDDPPLKVALRIVCAKIPQKDWQKPAAIQMVQDEADKIRGKIG